MESRLRPILFSGPMVRAIKEDRKTQTRRVISPQPKHLSPVRPYQTPEGLWKWVLAETGMGDGCVSTGFACPYGVVGDLLYVRETWRPDFSEADIYYRADGAVRRFLDREDWFASTYRKGKGKRSRKWRPSIHMPRWASRITLEITRIRVQQIQDIKPEECLAEGIVRGGGEFQEADLIKDFSDLWYMINEKRGFGWEVNPWVWVVTFKRIQENEST